MNRYGCEGSVTILKDQKGVPIFDQPDPSKNSRIMGIVFTKEDAETICHALNVLKSPGYNE